MSKPTDQLLELINDLARLIRTEADRRARAHGMTRAQWVILSRLERAPGLSQRELAEILEVEPITVARLVDRLERRGMVERRSDAGDRRIWRLHLRPGAATVLGALNVQREAIGQLVSEGVTASDLAQLTDVLLRMKANIGVCRNASPMKAVQETA